MTSGDKPASIWVIACQADTGCLERLGDARRIANAMDQCVGVLLVHPTRHGSGEDDFEDVGTMLSRYGADELLIASEANPGSLQRTESELSPIAKAETTLAAWKSYNVRMVFADGDPVSREWASLLAAMMKWRYINPALMARFRKGRTLVTQLDPSGRKSRQVELNDTETVVLTMREGVGEPMRPDEPSRGKIQFAPIVGETNRLRSRIIPADPLTSDIRDVNRLVAGGRGLGSKAGFDLLRDVAGQLNAGVAASRMAVDLGWIEAERQVGQTGKTVAPDVYIACGISGASHHLDGMRESNHIIAINTDVDAPIMKKANLALAADLYPVLESLKQQLKNHAAKSRSENQNTRPEKGSDS